MKNQNFPLNISKEEKTPLVKWLLEIINSLNKSNLEKEVKIEHLTEEINKLKKLKGKPQIKPSNLNDDPKKKSGKNSTRAGSEKKSKKITFKPDEEIVLKPSNIPEGSVFKGIMNFDVQELLIQNKNIRYKILKYKTPDGKYIQGELPENHKTHFGPVLKSFIIYQHHQCRIPQNIIHTQLREFGVDISEGQINFILTEKIDSFHNEKGEIFESGLETATYVFTDDTSARHKGKNNFCNVIGNDFFTIFNTTDSKSKKNFVEILGKHDSIYIFNEDTKEISQNYKIDEHERFVERIDHISEIRPSRRNNKIYEISVGAGVRFKDLAAYLGKRGFVLRCDPNTPRAATGGIAATGSNGGRKAFEVILHGRAITQDGTALCFAVSDEENQFIENEPFLLARKFFSIDNVKKFDEIFKELKKQKDTAEISKNPLKLLEQKQEFILPKLNSTKVGLKVPCHNTKEATLAQIELLKMYFKDVGVFDRCCGLSGTGRLKHPKIGTKISEKLFEQVEEFEPDVVVSGCPSCRDGVKIQRDILLAKGNITAEFEIASIFEQILNNKVTV